MIDMKNNSHVLWSHPKGELIRFDSEQDVKHFFSKMRLDPEQCDLFGIEVAFDEEKEEYKLHESGLKAPIFDYNDYFTEEEQVASRPSGYRSLYAKPEDIVVDNDVYRSFPCIAYCWYESDADRTGEMQVKIYNVLPLSDIKTPADYQAKEDKFIGLWVENLDRVTGNKPMINTVDV